MESLTTKQKDNIELLTTSIFTTTLALSRQSGLTAEHYEPVSTQIDNLDQLLKKYNILRLNKIIMSENKRIWVNQNLNILFEDQMFYIVSKEDKLLHDLKWK